MFFSLLNFGGHEHQMMRWTNDLFVSTKHRVVDPPPKSDQPHLSQERYSVAFFVHPDDDCVGTTKN
jgi:isopenicillin N synthase-like dioxygenase